MGKNMRGWVFYVAFGRETAGAAGWWELGNGKLYV